MLHRVFPARHGARPTELGGALYVPRASQSAGRHDSPDLYGALYASRSAVAAVAERLQALRGQRFEAADLVRVDGFVDVLVQIDDSQVTNVVDLDVPRELVRHHL